ncbi:hypothetical protein [Streptomyces sp. NPDC006285]|uniref:hypothetical protein n=1 Tax=Streptomyces sp. NPDC006285 TaxID=3364742 RepID=UPI00369FC74D
MSLRRTRSGMAAALVTALTLLVLPGGATAADGEEAAPAAADGNFYAWQYVTGGGKYCAWYGDDANWSTCSPGGSMRNQAGSIGNRGYPGAYEDVLVYWDNGDDAGGWDGARACIQNGWEYYHLYQEFFPNNGAGGTQKLENNISAHRWVHACTENPV